MPLEDALKTGESDVVEFKEGFSDKNIAQAIAAFANTISGNVFVGVADHGEIVGIPLATSTVKDRDVILQRVRNIAATSIKPPVFVRTKFLDMNGKIVLRVFVPRGSAPVYVVEGVVYLRHMASVMKAEPDQLLSIVTRWHKNA
jgi:predicted HTH transcriptional regulator